MHAIIISPTNVGLKSNVKNIFLTAALWLTVIAGFAQCTNYNIQVNGGVGAGQISWELSNSAGTTILSGGAPFNQNVCLPDDCYTLWMYDTGGDGWEFQDWVISDFIGDFDFNTNLADGSSGFDQFATGNASCGGTACPLGQALYTISVNDGNDAADVYWELYDSGFTMVASGIAPDEQQVCLADDCYTLWMYDATGDGWDNETWTIEDDQGNLIYATFLVTGFDGSESFAIGNASCSPPCQIYTIEVSDGIDAPDVFWELIDSFGVVQASGGANEFQNVCLLEDCYSLILYDFAGDGWSEVVITIYEGFSGFFYQTFLVSGSQVTETLPIGNVTCNDPVICGPGQSEYTFSVTSGLNPAEISWYFTLNNGIVQGGDAPYNSTICLGNGCYYLHMFDQGGDGWNGASYVLLDPLGNPVASGTMASGSNEWILINIGGLNCNGTEPPPAGACGSSPPTSDCFSAPCVCDVYTFHITPSGPGAVSDVPPPGSFSNPSYDGFSNIAPWGGNAPYGCLLAGELNSYWMMFTIATPGTLEFAFGAGGQQAGFYDWSMWPYSGAASCNGIANNTLAPVRCVWNSASYGGAGLASVVPPGGVPGNYAPPLNVTTGQQFIICMSNWSYVDALVTLDFFGTATIACSLMLPVELLDFRGYPAKDAVLLNWDTDHEIDNDHFVVEHSLDTKEWIEIGEIAGAGSDSRMHHYSFTDEYPADGMNYYRLKQYDYNGLYKTSEVVAIAFNVNDELQIAPNPANDIVKISFHDVEAPVTIQISDDRGRIVFERVGITSVPVEINTSYWDAAHYIVRCTSKNFSEVKRLVVIH